VTVLSAGQRAIAGRFAAAGRPSARLLIAGEAHHRGPRSGALVIDGGPAALECETRQRVTGGDHVLFIAEVLTVDYVDTGRPPLIRVNRRYR
jgi:flavin reductase (DIM6/NTAB) family NADH-FMN oxidoreductase RutF